MYSRVDKLGNIRGDIAILKYFRNNVSQSGQTQKHSRKHSKSQMFPQQCFPGWTNWEILEETAIREQLGNIRRNKTQRTCESWNKCDVCCYLQCASCSLPVWYQVFPAEEVGSLVRALPSCSERQLDGCHSLNHWSEKITKNRDVSSGSWGQLHESRKTLSRTG